MREGLEHPAKLPADSPASAAQTARAAIAILRPRQWVKNLLVLAAPLFAARLLEPPVLARTLAAFGAMCLVSSAIYIYNDFRDAADDRAHPEKANRPIASGALSERAALVYAAALAIAGLGVAIAVAPMVAVLAATYVALMVVYADWGRRHAPIDVFFIATGFLIRALVGSAAGPAPPSPWFLALTLLLALMLGFGKRRAELLLHSGQPQGARASLTAYSEEVLNQLLSVLAASVIVLYAIYAMGISQRLGSSDMILTWPLVLVGILRYLQLSHTTTQPPDELLVKDRTILVLVFLYALVAVVVLHFHTHLIGSASI